MASVKMKCDLTHCCRQAGLVRAIDEPLMYWVCNRDANMNTCTRPTWWRSCSRWLTGLKQSCTGAPRLRFLCSRPLLRGPGKRRVLWLLKLAMGLITAGRAWCEDVENSHQRCVCLRAELLQGVGSGFVC